VSRIEAENIIATLLANGRITKADMVEVMHARTASLPTSPVSSVSMCAAAA
jgi:hypothetical protein